MGDSGRRGQAVDENAIKMVVDQLLVMNAIIIHFKHVPKF